MDLTVIPNLERANNPPICGGRFYRSDENAYQNERGNIIHKTTLILQKRKSCPGCGVCASMEEYLQDYLLEALASSSFQENKFYEARWEETYRDWETGFVEAEVILVEVSQDYMGSLKKQRQEMVDASCSHS